MMKRYINNMLLVGIFFFPILTGCKKDKHTLPKVPPPNWTIQQAEQYSGSMTVVVQVPDNLLQYIQEEDELGAFINGECRGLGTLVQAGEISAFFILIHGTTSENGNIAFKYYSSSQSHLYFTDAFLPFKIDGAYGTVDVPMVLDLQPAK